MTPCQQEQIKLLYESGKSSKVIASELGLSVNTVKSWCRRHITNKSEPGVCIMCGVAITQTPHKREKKFCSDSCRMRWWSEHPERRSPKKLYHHVCKGCGRPFDSMREGSKYCSARCYAQSRSGGTND